MKTFSPDPTRPQADILAFACLMTSPEYGRWRLKRGKMPSLHSPQNIVRVLDTFTFHLGEITAEMNEAKEAVKRHDWRRAKELIEKSLAALNSFGPDGTNVLELIKKGASQNGSN